jgi:hypothetical protein
MIQRFPSRSGKRRLGFGVFTHVPRVFPDTCTSQVTMLLKSKLIARI